MEKKETVISPENLKKIQDLVKSIDFGTVTIVVQNGKIVQIERNEKFRLI